METIYKHLEDEINSLEVLESTDNISEWGLSKLNEFRMIKRQLEAITTLNGSSVEILELMKKALMKEYGISPETY